MSEEEQPKAVVVKSGQRNDYEDIEDVGRKLKLSKDDDITRWRLCNYEKYEEDSIDISDIVKGKAEYFDPLTLLHWKMPKNPEKLRDRNIPEIDTDCEQLSEFNLSFGSSSEADKKDIQSNLRQNLITEDNIEGQVQTIKENVIAEDQPVDSGYVENQIESSAKEVNFSIEVVNQKIARPEVQEKKKQEAIVEVRNNRNEVEKERQRQKRLRRCRNNRKQTFSRDVVEAIMSQFGNINQQNGANIIKEISDRFSLGKNLVLRMYKEWQGDPTMAKYTNSVEEPLGALIDGKRERTHSRIKIITELLDNNPYLTQNDISDKLFQRDKSKRRVLRSTIKRLLQIAGFERKRISAELGEEQIKLLLDQRKSFVEKYRELGEKKADFYYLGECLFHKYMGNDRFWTKSKKDTAPCHSKKFISAAMLLVAFLSPSGNLYWEVRGGDYQSEQYNQLLGRMLKKMSNRKNASHLSVVVISESSLRNYEVNQELVEKASAVALKYPKKSWQMNPLETIFMELRDRCKSFLHGSQQQAIKRFSEVASGFKKPEILGFINRCEPYLAKGLKQQYF